MGRDQVIVFVVGMCAGGLAVWVLLTHLGSRPLPDAGRMGARVDAGQEVSRDAVGGPSGPDVASPVGGASAPNPAPGPKPEPESEVPDSGLKALPQKESGPVAPPTVEESGPEAPPTVEESGPAAPPTVDAEDPEPEPIVWDPGREGIQAAIQENTEEFLKCFEAWLAVQPETGGKLVVGFTIAVPEGADPEDGARVVGVEPLDSELENAFMEGCVLGVFEGLKFTAPADGGEVKVRYPLRFSPE